MNKHGQTLILFVILIPIILLLLAFVVDLGLVITNKIKTEEVTKQVIKDAYLLDDNKEIFYSYNVNDIGDIYIRNHTSINRLKEDACYYMLEAYKYSRGYKSQKVMEEIYSHHEYRKVKEIIEKYFRLA